MSMLEPTAESEAREGWSLKQKHVWQREQLRKLLQGMHDLQFEDNNWWQPWGCSASKAPHSIATIRKSIIG